MEVLGTIENGLKTSLDVLRFIGDRLVGGAWGELPKPPLVDPDLVYVTPSPVKANIQYIKTGEKK